MNWLRRLFLTLIKMLSGRFAAVHIKRRGMIVYLRTLQAVRRSLLALILFVCCLQLMVIGAVGTFVTVVLLSNEDGKLWVLLAGFLILLVLPVAGLAILLSERLWFKFSGAEQFFANQPVPAPAPIAEVNQPAT